MQLLHVKQKMHLLGGDEELQALGVAGCMDGPGFDSIFDEIEQQDDADMVKAQTAVHDDSDVDEEFESEGAEGCDGVVDVDEWA